MRRLPEREGGLVHDPRESGARIASKTPGDGSIKFGRAVCFHVGDSDEMVRLPTAVNDLSTPLMGVSILDEARAYYPALADAGVDVSEPLAVLQDGAIWVRVEDAASPASPVFIRITESSDGAADQGRFRASADGGKAVLARGFKYLSRADAGALVRLAVAI